MPKLIKRCCQDQAAGLVRLVEDAFVHVADDEPVGPDKRDLIVSFARFQSDGAAWLAEARKIGVRLKPDEPVEQLAETLPRLSVVALEFPKFRDGRGYSAAALLRERYGYTGEIRAVGEVLRDQAWHLIHCGFDAFEPSDGSTPEAWARYAFRFRHAYRARTSGFPAAEAPATSE